MTDLEHSKLLHFSSVSFGVLCLFWPADAFVGVGSSYANGFVTGVAALVLLLWLLLAIHRVYGQS